MSPTTWASSLFTRRPSARRPSATRLGLHPLDDRLVPSAAAPLAPAALTGTVAAATPAATFQVGRITTLPGDRLSFTGTAPAGRQVALLPVGWETAIAAGGVSNTLGSATADAAGGWTITVDKKAVATGGAGSVTLTFLMVGPNSQTTTATVPRALFDLTPATASGSPTGVTLVAGTGTGDTGAGTATVTGPGVSAQPTATSVFRMTQIVSPSADLITFSGTAPPGSRVVLLPVGWETAIAAGGVSITLGSATADAAGRWNLTVAKQAVTTGGTGSVALTFQMYGPTVQAITASVPRALFNTSATGGEIR